MIIPGVNKGKIGSRKAGGHCIYMFIPSKCIYCTLTMFEVRLVRSRTMRVGSTERALYLTALSQKKDLKWFLNDV